MEVVGFCALRRKLVPILLIGGLIPVWMASGQAPGLIINVLEGEGAINNTRTHTGHDPVVEVRDQSGGTVAGASVTFQIPVNGPGGSFVGSQTLVVTTDEHGQAVGRGLHPNSVTGPFEIRVTASFQGQSGSAVVTQTNAAPAQAKSTKKYWVIALIAAGGAGGALAAAHGKSSSTPSSAATTTSSPTLSAGSPSFGPPH